jgi:hypothetical protein
MGKSYMAKKLDDLEEKARKEISPELKLCRSVVPELRDQPFIKVTWKCKLGLHRKICIYEEYAGPWILFCVHCGIVSYQNAGGGGFDGPEFFERYWGYGDPNIEHKIIIN